MKTAEARAALKGSGLIPVRAKRTFQYLRRFGFRPDLVVDVGVWDGTPWLYRAFPDTPFLLVDPLVESQVRCAAVAPARHDFVLAALGAEAGEADLAVPQAREGGAGALTGFHRRIDASARWTGETVARRVPVRRLDDVMAGRPGAVGLKIDTEGHEVAVLDGAPQTLARCEFVIVEVSVSARFEDTPLPSAIVGRLAAAGLELRDMLDMAPGDHDMPRHMDLLFSRWPRVQTGG
jgi:FkbM family methyltransferase